MVLEPEKFQDTFIVGPDVGKRTKTWTLFKSENSDKTIVHPEDFQTLNDMVASLRNHDLAMSLLQTKIRELSCYYYYPIYKDLDPVLVKVRSDALDYDRGFLIDVKTTQDACPVEFQRSAAKYKYDFQAAFYTDIFNTVPEFKFEKFIFIACEKKPPYDVQCYVADPDMIVKGRMKYRNAMERLAECMETGEYRGYPQQILNLTLPKWAE
jgi:hypothetical protein